jgi:pimeloyl-ACP methyl ester carboxylesterase
MMEKKDLKINGLNHTLWTAGDPGLPPLFFIHGFADSGSNFYWVTEYLKKDYFCIAPDLRGHGKTEASKNPLGYFFYEYVADIYQLFNHFSPNDPLLVVGHSMGGNILSLYGGACPTRLKAFVNIEGLGIQDLPFEKAPQIFSNWLNHSKASAKVTYPSLEKFSKHLQKRNPFMPEDRSLKVAANLLKKNDNDTWSLKVDPLHFLPNPYMYRFENVAPFFKKHKEKILFIESEHTNMGDWITPPASSPEEATDNRLRETLRRLNYFPHYQRKTLKNCGHMIHYDCPQDLAQEIFSFFKEV